VASRSERAALLERVVVALTSASAQNDSSDEVMERRGHRRKADPDRILLAGKRKRCRIAKQKNKTPKESPREDHRGKGKERQTAADHLSSSACGIYVEGPNRRPETA